jgi:hypothetical protein
MPEKSEPRERVVCCQPSFVVIESCVVPNLVFQEWSAFKANEQTRLVDKQLVMTMHPLF